MLTHYRILPRKSIFGLRTVENFNKSNMISNVFSRERVPEDIFSPYIRYCSGSIIKKWSSAIFYSSCLIKLQCLAQKWFLRIILTQRIFEKTKSCFRKRDLLHQEKKLNLQIHQCCSIMNVMFWLIGFFNTCLPRVKFY